MKGGWLHNDAIVKEFVGALHKLGADVRTEYPVRSGSRSPAVDIYTEFAGVRIACEIELGPRRVAGDIAKAQALTVDLLLIVTATPGQAAVIRRRLAKGKLSWPRIQVLPFGAALSLLSEMSRVPSLSNEGTNTRRKNR